MIERARYLEKLKKWKDKDVIKVITGIRRCGKSTLFAIFIDYLKKEKIDSDHIISVNLEMPEYNFDDYKSLYDYIKNKIKDNKKYYVFIDEVQTVPKWEKAVDGLYINKNIDIYITGSNAYLLSGELATLLSGRYIEIEMLPLSFKEFKEYYKDESLANLYVKYVNNSSFPYTLNLEEDEISTYLDSLFNTILVKDILTRKKITDTTILKNLTQFLFSVIGSPLSIRKIADTLTSKGRKISAHTIESYLNALTESYIFYKVPRYDVKGKQYLQTNDKYYAADVAMRYSLLGRKNMDLGHILENIVYLELRRRGYKIFIGKNGDKEVDFVCENADGVIYVQVSLSLRDEKTLKRELEALQTINDHYPKYLLTMDNDPKVDYDGIKKMNVLEWLLEDYK